MGGSLFPSCSCSSSLEVSCGSVSKETLGIQDLDISFVTIRDIRWVMAYHKSILSSITGISRLPDPIPVLCLGILSDTVSLRGHLYRR